MTTVRTDCAHGCGQVTLTADDITLELAAGQGDGRYRFNCPTCGRPARRPATQQTVSILLASGARPTLTPADVDEAARRIGAATTSEILRAAGA